MTVATGALCVSDFHVFEEAGAAQVLVVATSALFRVEGDALRILYALRDQRNGPFDPNALQAHPGLGRSLRSEELDEIIEELRTLDILIAQGRSGTDEGVRRDSLLQFTQPPVGTVTALVSKDCNLKCGYCYADQGQFGTGTGGEMEFETSRKLMDLLIANAGALPEITYQFLGGEPLLNAKTMRQIIAYGQDEAIKIGKKIKFGLTTNGTFLTPEIVEYFLANDVQVTISIDGPEHVNDLVRVNHAGKGSYQRIIKAVQPLLRARPTRARVTVTKHCLDMEMITDHLLQEGFYEVGLTPVNSTDPKYALDDDDRAELLNQFRRLVQRYVSEAQAGRRYGFANLSELLRQVHEGRSQAHPCGAGISMFATDAEGVIYPCHRFPGEEGYAMGHVDTGIDREKQSQWLAQVHVHNRSACQSCWARYICSGGCYYLSAIEYGDVTKTFTPICDHLREWYQLGLWAYAELVESCPEFLGRIGITAGDV